MIISCSVPSNKKIVLNGMFEEDCTITCLIKKGKNPTYIEVGRFFINKDASLQKVCFVIQEQDKKNIIDYIFLINSETVNCITLKSISLESIATISDFKLFSSIHWKRDVDIKFENHQTIICHSPPTQGEFAVSSSFFHIDCIYPFYLLLLVVVIGYCVVVQKSKRFLLLTVVIYMATLPLKISWANWALGLFVLTITTHSFLNRRRIKPPKIFYLIFSIYLLLLAGSFYSINSSSLGNLICSIPLIIFPFLFSILSFKNRYIPILSFFVLSTVLFCIYCLISYLIAASLLSINPLDAVLKNHFFLLFPYPLFSHPSFITIITLMAIPIAIYLKKEKIMKWIELLLLIGLISTVILLSGSRIGLIAIPLLLLLGLLFYIKAHQYIKYSIIICVSIIASLAILRVPLIKEKFNDPIRQDLRSTAIASIKEKPFFGWGTASMETLLHSEEIAQKAGLEKPIAEFNHFHNQYLDMLVQFGFIGSIPFFALFIYLIYLAIKKKDFLLMAYLAIYLPFMWVESPFATAKGIQPMIFWLCFLVSTQKVRLDDEAAAPHPENNKSVNRIS